MLSTSSAHHPLHRLHGFFLLALVSLICRVQPSKTTERVKAYVEQGDQCDSNETCSQHYLLLLQKNAHSKGAVTTLEGSQKFKGLLEAADGAASAATVSTASAAESILAPLNAIVIFSIICALLALGTYLYIRNSAEDINLRGGPQSSSFGNGAKWSDDQSTFESTAQECHAPLGNLSPSYTAAVVILVLLTVLWAAQHSVMKAVVQSDVGTVSPIGDVSKEKYAALTPAVVMLLRFGIAMICLAPALPICGHTELVASEDVAAGTLADARSSHLEWWGGLELSAYQLLGFALQTVGLLYTTAQRSCLLLYLNVQFVPFFLCFLFRQRVAAATWLSAATAVAGTTLLLSGGKATGVPPNVGDLLSLLAAVSSAFFIIRLERYASQTNCQALNAVIMTFVTLMCIPWVLALALGATPAREDGSKAVQDAIKLAFQFSLSLLQSHWRELLFLGVVVTAFGNWTQTWAQRIVPAPFAAVIFALDPIWGCLIARIWLGEQLSFQGLLGAFLLLFAVIGQLVYRATRDA